MLRASIESQGGTFHDRAVVDTKVDSGLEGGHALIALADATVTRDLRRIDEARAAVTAALGRKALADAATVIGNFEMMNRVADATGMPVAASRRAVWAALLDDAQLPRP